MIQPIRAVYRNGQLQLLDPVDLTEGQEIQMMILPDKEQVRTALGDLLIETTYPLDEDIDEGALFQEIEEAFRDLPPLSQTIIDERGEGV